MMRTIWETIKETKRQKILGDDLKEYKKLAEEIRKYLLTYGPSALNNELIMINYSKTCKTLPNGVNMEYEDIILSSSDSVLNNNPKNKLLSYPIVPMRFSFETLKKVLNEDPKLKQKGISCFDFNIHKLSEPIAVKTVPFTDNESIVTHYGYMEIVFKDL